MSQLTPPTIDPAPAVPIRGTPTFKILVDAFLTWLALAVAQFSAVATNVYNNALDCYSNATAALGAAVSATGSAASASSYASTALSAVNTPAYNDTSTSSVAIGTGNKVFTVTAGKSFGAGMNLVMQATAGNNMTGTVVSYAGTTLTVNVVATNGSGTFASWAIGLAPATRGRVLLATLAPSTPVAALNALTVFNAQYDSYDIEGEGLCPSVDGALGIYLAVAGTLVTASVYAPSTPFSVTATPYNGGAGFNVSAIGAAGGGINFKATVINVNDATNLKSVLYQASYDNTTPAMVHVTGAIGFKGGVVTGIGFNCTGAINFKAQGSIRIYGNQKA